jgi:uncharacterized protein (TIGR03435 family)
MRRIVVVAGLMLGVVRGVAQEMPSGKRLEFEVASVRQAKPDARGGYIKALPGGAEYVAQNMSVAVMFSLMYKVPMRQIEGAPEWMRTDGYDIDAKADGRYSLDDLHVMYQHLLADRFQIKFHTVTREGPVYALLLDKGGLKMKPNESAENFAIPLTYGADGAAVGVRVPMVYLCWWLGQNLQRDERPVIDRTGLTGFYDFRMDFVPPGFEGSGRDGGGVEKPSIFVAVKEQLGLRLEAQRGPVVYYVIDSVTRPGEN